jgi:MFS family permease
MSIPWVLRHPTLRYLTLLCAFWALSLGLTIPFLTLTARERGVSVDAIGIIAASYLLTQIFLQYPFGALSDRIGRTAPLAAGIAIFSIATAGFIVADSTLMFIVLRSGQGVGFALGYPAFRAMIADVTAPNQRGRAYAAMSTAYSSGLLIGPAIGGGVAHVVGRDALFGVTATIVAFLAIGVVTRLRGHGRLAGRRPDGERIPFSAILTRPLIVAFLLAFVANIQLGLVESIWSLFISDRGGSDLIVGVSFSTIALARLALLPWGGRLADRGDQTRLLLVGFCTMAMVMGGYGVTPWVVGILVLGFAEGAAAAIAFPALDAFLASKADPRIMGRVQGMFNSSMMAGATFSALGGSVLYRLSPGLPFIVGGIALAIVTIVAVNLIRGARQPAPYLPPAAEVTPGVVS